MPGIFRAWRNRRTTERDTQREQMMKIGEWLREHREAQGMTQQTLADLIGVSLSRMSKIETGKDFPAPERYATYAAALHIDPRAFGMFMLQEGDPWLFSMIYGEDSVKHMRLEDIPPRQLKAGPQRNN